jgi:hypothetical protein
MDIPEPRRGSLSHRLPESNKLDGSNILIVCSCELNDIKYLFLERQKQRRSIT